VKMHLGQISFMSLAKSYLMKKKIDVIDSYNKVTRYI
jgi:hypothetical protein